MADLTAMLQAAAGNVGGDYQISRSLRFNSADSAYLSRTPASAGNRKTWTWSGWVKRTSDANYQEIFSANNNDSAAFDLAFNGTVLGAYLGTGPNLVGSAVYRDFSAWYHIVCAVDTTQATSSNRIKLYVNGVQITAFSASNYPSPDFEYDVNNTTAHAIGRQGGSAQHYLNAYLADIHFIDGQALTPSSFGEVDSVTGVWKPIAYAGTYGTNGFYLDFSDNTSTTTLGYDAAGSNDWTLNNFSVTAGAGNDSLVDSPTQYGTDTGAGGEVRGNYATFNPLQTTATLSDGNLQAVCASGAYRPAFSTIGVSSGKWYCEFVVTAASGTYFGSVGIAKTPLSTTTFLGSSTMTSYAYEGDGGQKVNNGSYTAYGATWTTNDVIGVALDLDAGTLVFYKNGVSQGTAFTGLSGEFFFGVSQQADTDAQTYVANFGQRPFAYTAPSGFKALCTTNLPDPTVLQGDDYFNTVLYTGDGGTQSVTGVGFQPDFVWIKERSSTSSNNLWDVVRGATEALFSNLTDAETTQAAGLQSFNTNGFTTGDAGFTNENTQTYVAWNWKANGAGVSNTAGTIGTSTVSANTTAGISIVTYTGTGSAATVGHGLGAVPRMIIVKNRDQADAWQVYHAANTANPETDYLVLNTTAATADAADRWNDTLPTSTVFSIGNGVEVNTNTEKYVAYCFAEVEGFSKFGSYTGNGSTNGPFVYTGFRPAFLMTKRTTSAVGGGHWVIKDTQRSLYNVTSDNLFANLNNAESVEYPFDILSNGFKVRDTNVDVNNSGGTYIFMAFAENPFKNALAR